MCIKTNYEELKNRHKDLLNKIQDLQNEVNRVENQLLLNKLDAIKLGEILNLTKWKIEFNCLYPSPSSNHKIVKIICEKIIKLIDSCDRDTVYFGDTYGSGNFIYIDFPYVHLGFSDITNKLTDNEKIKNLIYFAKELNLEIDTSNIDNKIKDYEQDIKHEMNFKKFIEDTINE